ncbi:hypothetical protein [Serratia ficaria]|uniref:hypothetical protein n=1 Tax=Serratia ficaria TaxID=61651 RepID=UPI00217C733C|nr:hypothetical protein [Serratia ficaria]CAI1507525.1 Uncharacterised protein [Serratia ficaria]
MATSSASVYFACLPLIFACGHPVFAADKATSSALSLADNSKFEETEYNALSMFAESAARFNQSRKYPAQRFSLDTRWDTPILSHEMNHWRLMVSHRLDNYFSRRMHHNQTVSSLREAYLAYQLTPQTLINIGRVNTRYGVAFGYNPTDFLGKGTAQKVDSGDPDVQRFNRLGNAMIQLQQLWSRASVTAIISPELGADSGKGNRGLNWRTSNPDNRLLLVASYQVTDNFNPQVLFYQERHKSPQLGLNMSYVLSRSTLAYLEGAGGREPEPWASMAPGSGKETAWHNRVAFGATWSGAAHQTLRLEGHYNGAADSRRADKALSSLAYYASTGGRPMRRLSEQQTQDYMMSRRALLGQLFWKDVFDRYDLNFLWQHDLQRHKNTGFIELRRHAGPVDIAVQWQKTYEMKNNIITPDQIWLLSASYYF